MTPSPVDQALLDAQLTALTEAVEAARWASNTDECKAALHLAWAANTRARQIISEIEERTRVGALKALEAA